MFYHIGKGGKGQASVLTLSFGGGNMHEDVVRGAILSEKIVDSAKHLNRSVGG